MAEKVRVASSAVVSVLLYNAGVWGWVGTGALRTLKVEYELLFRAATGHVRGPDAAARVETMTILDDHGVPEFTLVLRAVRLRYLGRLLCAAPPLLLALLQGTPVRVGRQGTWIAMVRDDL